jgi:hypothetical protein
MKTEFKGTPGPWKVARIMGVADAVVANNKKEYTICDCSPSIRISTDQKLANAKLIAAAPELFEALRGLLTFCKSHNMDNYYTEQAEQAINTSLNG